MDADEARELEEACPIFQPDYPVFTIINRLSVGNMPPEYTVLLTERNDGAGKVFQLFTDQDAAQSSVETFPEPDMWKIVPIDSVKMLLELLHRLNNLGCRFVVKDFNPKVTVHRYFPIEQFISYLNSVPQ